MGGEDKLLYPQDSGDITASNGKNLQQLDFQSAVLVCLPGLDGSHTHRHTHTADDMLLHTWGEMFRTFPSDYWINSCFWKSGVTRRPAQPLLSPPFCCSLTHPSHPSQPLSSFPPVPTALFALTPLHSPPPPPLPAAPATRQISPWRRRLTPFGFHLCCRRRLHSCCITPVSFAKSRGGSCAFVRKKRAHTDAQARVN